MMRLPTPELPPAVVARLDTELAAWLGLSDQPATSPDEIATALIADYADLSAEIITAIQNKLFELSETKAKLNQLTHLLREKEEVERKKHLYTDQWWLKQTEQLRSIFAKDAKSGLNLWHQLFAKALVDWQLETCRKLALEELGLPFRALGGVLKLLHVVDKIVADELTETRLATTLNALIAHESLTGMPTTRGLLHVLVGRLYLHKLGDLAAARQQAQLADSDHAPNHPHTLALWGEIELADTTTEVIHADGFFDRALEADANDPVGYIGKAAVAAHNDWHSEEADWLNRALAVMTDADLMLAQAGRLLAPLSGNVLAQMAFSLESAEKYEQAARVAQKAIDSGIEDGTQYPNRHVMTTLGRSKYEIASDKQNDVGSAEPLYQAGRHYYYNGEFSAAIANFERVGAIFEGSTYADNYWYWADCLLLTSAIPTPPYNDEARLREAWQLAQMGLTFSAEKTKTDAWHYLLLGRIIGRLGPFNDDPREAYWQAIIFAERAVRLNPNSQSYADIALQCRDVDLHHNGLHSAEKAHALEQSTYSQEALAAALINVGYYEQALPHIDAIIHHADDSSVYKGWRSLTLRYLERYEEALRDIEANLETYPTDLWSRELRANNALMLGDTTTALEDFQFIYANSADKPSHAPHAFWAALMQGEVENAATFQKIKRQIHADTEPMLEIDEMWLALAGGDLITAEAKFTAALPEIIVPREFDAIVYNCRVYRLHPHLLTQANNLSQSQVVSFLDGILAQILAAKSAFNSPADARKLELRRLLPTAPPTAKTSLLVMLGRLAMEEENWIEAAEIYGQLEQNPLFPESAELVQVANDNLLESAIGQLTSGDLTGATQTLALLQSHPTTALGLVSTLNGAADFLQGNRAAATTAWQTACDQIATDQADLRGIEFGSNLIRAIGADLQRYWQLVDAAVWFSAESNQPSAFMDGVRQVLLTHLEQTLGLASTNISYDTPLVTPIAIEMGENLVPDDVSPAGWRLLGELIPRFREAIRDEFEVRLPGIRLRDNTNFVGQYANSYYIILDENPTLFDSVEPNRAFIVGDGATLAALGVSPSDAISAAMPPFQRSGFWVPQSAINAAKTTGVELYAGSDEYILGVLRQVLAMNLQNAVGLQETSIYLDEWEVESGQDLSGFKSAPRLRQLTKVLKRLFFEQVSIKQWQQILPIVRAKSAASFSLIDLISEIRLNLAQHLPGNDADAVIFMLPTDLEAIISEGVIKHEDGPLFAIDPHRLKDFIDKLRALLPENTTTLVVASDAVRFYLVSLFSFEFKQLLAVTEAEYAEAQTRRGAQ